MKLKFKIQQYQTDAVESVINVFKGQPNQANLEYRMDKGKLYVVDSKKHDIKIVQTNVFADSDDAGNSLGYKNNRLAMDKVALFDNIRQIQTDNNIHQDEELCQKLGACQLDVEMETGTGKTYVYIKTMFELNKQYGWTKFIVVVPSIAIREGVKKSFDITVDHFMEQYGKKARYFIYDSSSLNDIDTFSQSNDISVMIINTQAFNTMKEGAKNKAARIINSERDEFGSRKPIAVLAANNPIIILDEPQKMGGAATQTALKAFNPLFTLNYYRYPQGTPQHGVCTRCSRCLQPQTGEEDRGSRLRTEEPERYRQLYLFCRAAAFERQGSTGKTGDRTAEHYGSHQANLQEVGRRR